jgi:hypothetical protein
MRAVEPDRGQACDGDGRTLGDDRREVRGDGEALSPVQVTMPLALVQAACADEAMASAAKTLTLPSSAHLDAPFRMFTLYFIAPQPAYTEDPRSFD